MSITTLIMILVPCAALAVGAIWLLMWMATRKTPDGMFSDDDPKTAAQKLIKAQKDFGNEWGAHG